MNKKIKAFYSENYSIGMKVDIEVEKTFHHSVFMGWKMFMLPKAIYRLNVISVKIPVAFFTELEKNPKSHMEAKVSEYIKLEQKEQS